MAVFIRFIGFVAAITGIVQGIAWTCLSLAAILIRYEVWVIKFDDTYNGKLNSALVDLFRRDGIDLSPNKYIVTPDILAACIFGYLGVSIIWALLGTWQLLVLENRKEKSCRSSFVSLAIWTIVVCILDAILTIFLIMDHNDLLEILNTNENLPIIYYYALLAKGIVIILAGKGFILWIFNVSVAILLLVAIVRYPKEMSDMQHTPLAAYDSVSILNGSVDRLNSIYTRSNSFDAGGPYKFALPRLASVPTVTTTAERLAQMSRAAGRYSPPSPPTYSSPPSSVNQYPALKPAIKTHRNYMYGEKY